MIYADCCERGRQFVAKFEDSEQWYFTFSVTENREYQYHFCISFCPFCGRKLGESAATVEDASTFGLPSPGSPGSPERIQAEELRNKLLNKIVDAIPKESP